MTNNEHPIQRITYAAPPTLTRFHASDAFYRGVMGPVGSGKSTAMCMELMRRAQAQQPGPDGMRRSRFAIVRNTYRELADTTLKTWLDWFPEDLFGQYNQTGMTHTVRFGDVHAEFMFRSLDRPGDVKKLLSLELTGAWFNECREMPKAIVDAMGDRVERFPPRRMGGCSWAGVIMDTNPPDTDHWWYRLAEEDRPRGWAFFRQPGGLLEKGEENGRPRFAPNPNAENLTNLPEQYYLRRMAGKPADHIRVYYCAKYGSVQDGKPVFPEFHATVHVASTPLRARPESPLFVGLDFGLTPAAVFGQREINGRWLWLGELVAEDMGMTRFARELRRTLNERWPGMEVVLYGDPAGTQRSQVDERTPFDILRAGGIDARPAPSNDPLLRREAVALPLTRMVDGGPGLLTSPECRTLIKGMCGAYRYRRVEISGEERYKDEPDKNRYSHVCDAAQYLMIGAGEGRAVLGRDAGPRPARAENHYNPFRRSV
ncbi:hypothetical protein SAMN02745704_01884 [Paucidesulfovibrio gracilis DSM 16080]|uniref:Terminase-like family protein n=1 Tax=Paucidesulfovibrio gracilis DSM 16080 TaxID=1121449 RepID=A0A1T4X7D9_9BACT|nr:hypothetical protein [Paucidesulfovibrio gracilis]SKA85544.1 hypothetical protein SAMN02745704_01884 [Paucidesulfovibrio gracilis DSM 16080]